MKVLSTSFGKTGQPAFWGQLSSPPRRSLSAPRTGRRRLSPDSAAGTQLPRFAGWCHGRFILECSVVSQLRGRSCTGLGDRWGPPHLRVRRSEDRVRHDLTVVTSPGVAADRAPRGRAPRNGRARWIRGWACRGRSAAYGRASAGTGVATAEWGGCWTPRSSCRRGYLLAVPVRAAVRLTGTP